jgi:hypothetical protein
MKRFSQKPTIPGTVIDHRGITLSAGVAAFDRALVERFKDFVNAPADAEQITSDAFGEEGPVVGLAAYQFPWLRGDDDAA